MIVMGKLLVDGEQICVFLVLGGQVKWVEGIPPRLIL